MIDRIEQFLQGSVDEVFTTMADMTLSPRDAGDLEGEEKIASSVGFAGDLFGVVYIFSTRAFARRLTTKMLRLDEGEECDDAMVIDAIGEITNMVAGSLKTKMSGDSVNCALTVPSVIKGGNFEIESLRYQQQRSFDYQVGPDHVKVQVFVRGDQGRVDRN